MKIAYVVQRLVYPPDGGTPIRNFNFIRRAAARNEVHVFGFTDREKFPDILQGLGANMHLLPSLPPRRLSRRMLDTATSRHPDLAFRTYSRELLYTLRQALPRVSPDLIQIQALDMAYTIGAIREAAPSALIVLDQHNAEYVLQQRAFTIDRTIPRRWPQALYSLLQWHRLKSYERRSCNQADLVIAASEQDARLLAALGVTRRIVVVSNGVDLAEYRDVTPSETMLDIPGYHFVFTGKMDYRPNADAAIWFARSVFPRIRHALPESHLWIVGRQPPPSVCELADTVHVHVTREVPDVKPYMAAATAVVAPLRMGAGTKLKVLEAAALCKPVVATPVAVEGYRVVHERDLLVAENELEFAQACLRVARDADLARQLGHNAYRNLAVPLDWDKLYAKLESAYVSSSQR